MFKKALIKSVFSNSNYWFKLDILYRVKIALGILEFYAQAPEFNPNDELGLDSLLLCAPVEDSFGYTFGNEAKLVNYNELLSAREAIDRLGRHKCTADSDCMLTKQCAFQCDTAATKCTTKLVSLLNN